MTPVFVCGTGRSGTTIFTHLLGCHPDVWAFKWESQIFAGIPGLGDLLLSGFLPRQLDTFVDRVVGHLYRRRVRDTYDAGLFEIVEESQLTNLLEDFRRDIEVATDNRGHLQACRDLADGIFVPAARAQGAGIWCEKTPRNLLYADLISRIYPEAKFIHVVRDGRDVLSSMLSRNFWPVARSARYPLTNDFHGQVEFEKAADYWSILIDIAEEQELMVGRSRWLNVRLEDITMDPGKAFGPVFDFLEIEQSDDAIAQMGQHVKSGSVHAQRWRDDLTTEQAGAILDLSGANLRRYGYL